MPVIPELKKWKLENYTFKALLGYISKYEAILGQMRLCLKISL